ncbi:MAG: hypothetical protein JWM72_1101 [Actinomycetia bacterium]|jgi:hypothetical protein|nr:hypothetical protein [Actinomycetes bacterium]MDQ1459559.1 hypothetical protein [Actinomycetota bacterium]
MPDDKDSKRVQSRADTLLPEEQAAGSDDPNAQAEEILADSDARAEYRDVPEAAPIEHRTSEDTVEPTD